MVLFAKVVLSTLALLPFFVFIEKRLGQHWMNMDTLHSYLTFYLLAINIAAFALYGIDKYKARKAKWRISEAKLLTTAVLGGSIGAWLGMKIWHHKTMHKKFKYSIPVILLIQIALMAYLHHIV